MQCISTFPDPYGSVGGVESMWHASPSRRHRGAFLVSSHSVIADIQEPYPCHYRKVRHLSPVFSVPACILTELFPAVVTGSTPTAIAPPAPRQTAALRPRKSLSSGPQRPYAHASTAAAEAISRAPAANSCPYVSRSSAKTCRGAWRVYRACWLCGSSFVR